MPPRSGNASGSLESDFVTPSARFLDETRARAASLVPARPIQSGVAVLVAPETPLALPKRPRWRYQMSKAELDANEHACFRTWLAQQDAIIERWQRTRPGDAEMPHPPAHYERNIEVWRQFWRVTEMSEILLVLLDARCPPVHLPSSLAAYLDIPTSVSQQQGSPGSRPKRSGVSRTILVLTKVDISGPARTASWTSWLNHNYPGVPVVPVEAYAQKSTHKAKQGPTRYEPYLPGTFREKLVHTLQDVHEQLLRPPPWVTAPRVGESEEERLRRIDQWKPRVKRVINWDAVLTAKGKWVGKTVGGSAGGRDIQHGAEAEEVPESKEKQGAEEWKEPECLTIGLVGQPNVGKSSLLNAIFGSIRVRASRTPGKTKHFQTLFWTSDVRLVDCPGLVMPSFTPMDIQVLAGVLPIARIAAVPFCVHQLALLLPLERILELAHPALREHKPVPSTRNRGRVAKSSKSASEPPVPVEDKRTWRPGQRPPEQLKAPVLPRGWTAIDIMSAYAEKEGWVTAKAGRPDIHRAGNAILRLVAEGKIPWAFWPPGSPVSGDDGIWLRGGTSTYADDSSEEDSAKGETASDGDTTSSEDDGVSLLRGGTLGRFGVLSVDD